MKQHSFEKFINKETGAKKKEAIKQQKRKWKAERNKKFEERSTKDEVSSETRKSTNPGAKPNAEGRKPVNESSKLTAQSRKPSSEMPLNKFIAHAGITSRREAAEFVKQGKIKVNNQIIIDPGFKVNATDKISFNNKLLHIQRDLVYILLNKPKDYITTAKDPEGRKTIFELLKGATDERIFPVGRLDRNTTGVLLLTNDGDLTQKLTHPSYEVKKIYEVKLDKPLQKKDSEAILNGLQLDDGFIKADAIGYADVKNKAVIGIEIHSGRNRIVRRVFEHLGYEVKSLDRVLFANLTKKNIDRGKWRYLNEKEIRLLKYMNQSFLKKKIQH